MHRPTEQLHRYNICGRPTFYRSVFSLQKDKAPETAILGISCFRGSACSICTIIFPFSGNPHREHGFFRRGETAGLLAFHFPDRHPICQKTGLYHIHHDVILQRSGVFIAAWSRNCSVPSPLHDFYKKELKYICLKWVDSGSLWVEPGPGKGWVFMTESLFSFLFVWCLHYMPYQMECQ